MQSRSDQTAVGGGRIIFLASLILFSVAYIFRLPGGVLDDPFHQGEYFAVLATLLGNGVDFLPLSIHGALDYLPGLVALQFSSAEYHFFPTWLLYRCLDLVAGFLFVLLAFDFLRGKPHAIKVMIAIAAMSSMLVGYRDVMLLLAIHLYFLAAKEQYPVRRYLLESAFGLVVALGVFWSFDRGLAGALSLGLACLVHAYYARRYVLAMVIFFTTLVGIGFFSPWFSLAGYIDNLRFLAATSSQWSYGWALRPATLTIFLVLLNALVIMLFFYSRKVFARTPNNGLIERDGIIFLADGLFLIVLSIFLMKIGSNRADMQHVLMGCWGPLLAVLYWYGRAPAEVTGRVLSEHALKRAVIFFLVCAVLAGLRIRVALPLLAVLAIFLIAETTAKRDVYMTRILIFVATFPLLAALLAVSKGYQHGDYDWLRYVFAPPANATLVPDGVGWASQTLQESGAPCVFDMANNGVINGLTGLPACTRFTYPVYANRDYEVEIIDALRRRPPPAIVYSTTFWSYDIDGKAMPARFPVLDVFLRRTYADEKCAQGYCIRYLRR